MPAILLLASVISVNSSSMQLICLLAMIRSNTLNIAVNHRLISWGATFSCCQMCWLVTKELDKACGKYLRFFQYLLYKQHLRRKQFTTSKHWRNTFIRSLRQYMWAILVARHTLSRKLLFKCLSRWKLDSPAYVHCESKKHPTILLSVTSPNVDRFSIFFQLQN